MAKLVISVEEARDNARKMNELLQEIERTLDAVSNEMAETEGVYKGEAAKTAREQYENLKSGVYPKFKETIKSMSEKLLYAASTHEQTEEEVKQEASQLL